MAYRLMTRVRIFDTKDLSFDHRSITGREACRFLAALSADFEHQ